MAVTLSQIQQTLAAHGEPHHELTLDGGVTLCVTQRGGRAYAFDRHGESLYWIAPAWATPNAFAAFRQEGAWNLGGERVWLAPEIQYIIHDRRDFWGTHNLPPAIDPGQYTLTASETGCTLTQEIELQAYNTARGDKRLHVTRTITPIADPLRSLKAYHELLHDVAFSGYQQVVTLRDLGGSPMYSEAWNLVQLQPGGRLTIPVTAPPQVSHYFGQPPTDALTAADGRLRIQITGQQQYKVGYKAAMMTGRMAYQHTTPAGQGYLLIRDFNNNPSAVYAEEPPDEPGERGHSVHVYNDSGELGGFGEMECSGEAIGGDTGRTTGTDVFRMWIYIGPPDRLTAIAALLLGRAP